MSVAIEQAAQALQNADAVFIGAGAGLSAAAGLDYSDEVAFAKKFPGMLQYGFRCQYQLMGYPFPDESLKWGYLAASLDYVYKAQPATVYQNLLRIVANKPYFVMTSNVDRYFHKNGFDVDYIYTPQGDYENLQCETPCTDATWAGRPLVAAMMPSLNRETQRIEDKTTLPVCPNCGESVFMNVRGGSWFIDKPYIAGAERAEQWLQQHRNSRIVALEIGAGFNTPGVIRMPLEQIGTRLPDSTFIRINKQYWQGPEGTISIPMSADDAIAEICDVLGISSG